jgi:hypothetical protein
MPKEPDKLARKRLNAAEKRALAAARVGYFVQQYGRKAHKGNDPNDRSYDRKVERAVKRMKPGKLDELLWDDEE